MEKVFVIPEPGVLVRHENGKPLAAVGEAVERSAYWLRRERDGDVKIGPVPPATTASEPATTASEPAAAPTKKTTKA